MPPEALPVYRLDRGLIKDKACCTHREWFWRLSRIASWDKTGKWKTSRHKGIRMSCKQGKDQRAKLCKFSHVESFLETLKARFPAGSCLKNCSCFHWIISYYFYSNNNGICTRAWRFNFDLEAFSQTPVVVCFTSSWPSKQGRKGKPALFCVAFEGPLWHHPLTFQQGDSLCRRPQMGIYRYQRRVAFHCFLISDIFRRLLIYHVGFANL